MKGRRDGDFYIKCHKKVTTWANGSSMEALGSWGYRQVFQGVTTDTGNKSEAHWVFPSFMGRHSFLG